MYYYDYKNIFVAGNQKRIEEYYGKGGRNRIEQLKDADLSIIKIRLDKNTINNEIPIATYFISSDGN